METKLAGQLTVAVLQTPGLDRDKAGNVELLASAAWSAREAGAALLVTPEMFLTGYAIGASEVRRLAEPATGPALRRVGEIARETGVGLVVGYPEQGDGRIFNATAYVGPDGAVVANHRKSHLFGRLDRDAFSAGDGAPVLFDAGPFKAGLLICYDVEFPENARQLAVRGADLIVVPTALMEPYAFIPTALVPTRAYENQVFLVYANRCGREAALTYCGRSAVIGPDGMDLARSASGPALLVATLDGVLLAKSRALNTYLADRRPNLYSSLTFNTPNTEEGEALK